MHAIDQNSYELGAIRLTLRRDLTFRRQSQGAETHYVIEDAIGSRFFRIGYPEYGFLSLLDGRTSIAEAVAETATRYGNDAFTETQAAALCRWLIENSLASTTQSASAARLAEQAGQVASKRRREWLNPLMLKVPLWRPQQALEQLCTGLGWIFSSVGLAVWLTVAIFAAWRMWLNLDHFTISTSSVLSVDNWIWLGITWLVLKTAHETAHALACCRFGGETREAGILLLLFVPLPYVDVTTSWRFGRKWQRIAVSAAGMYAEFFLASVAAIVWTSTDSTLIQFHACNVMVTAAFVTILFNINPLMRFDGYYILCDLLDLPNLATHGQQDVMSLARRWLLGISETPPEWPEGRRIIIRVYGLASLAWKCIVLISLTLAAAALYHGAGIALAAIAVFLWLFLPLARFTKYLILCDSTHPPNRLRFVGIMAGCGIIGFGIWNHVPYVEQIRLPATVDHDPAIHVRTATSGFVRQVQVQPGQTVEAGELLVVLENPELASQMHQLKLDAQISALDATAYHRQGRLAALQIEQENLAAIQKRLTEVSTQIDHLKVRAPISGTVLNRNALSLKDRWITAGTEVAILGNDAQRSIRIVIPQSDIEAIKSAINEPAQIHIWGSPVGDVHGTIADVAPRGSSDLRYPSLAAVSGGPLPVRQSPISDSQEQPQWQLLEPHFYGRVALNQQTLRLLGTGQTGIVEIRANRGSVGDVITAATSKMLNQSLRLQ